MRDSRTAAVSICLPVAGVGSDLAVHSSYAAGCWINDEDKLISDVPDDAGMASCSRTPTCCPTSSRGRGGRGRRCSSGCGWRAGGWTARRRGTERRSCTSLQVCFRTSYDHLRRT